MSVYLEKKTGKYCYDFQHKKKRYLLGGFRTKKEGRAAEAALKEELKRSWAMYGTDMAFFDLVQKRMDWLKERRGKRLYRDTLYVARRWVKQWNGMLVSEVTPEMIENYLTEIKNNISVTTANKELRYIKALFNHGIKAPRRWFRHNPTEGIGFFSTNHKVERYIPPVKDVLKVIMAATPEQQDYLWTIALTMGRMGEVNRLEWDDVDFEGNFITLYTRKKRGGHLSPRQIPMVPKLKEIMQRMYFNKRKNHPWIFWHKYWSSVQSGFVEGPYTDRKKMMATLCKKAGVKYFRFHPLRHFGATMLERAGIPIKTIQSLLGHESRVTTEIYLHSAERDERSAMEHLEKEFLKKVPEKSHEKQKGYHLD